MESSTVVGFLETRRFIPRSVGRCICVWNTTQGGGGAQPAHRKGVCHPSEGFARVDVDQPSQATDARIVDKSKRGASGGFGPFIVEKLSSSWRVETGPPGHVWFEIRRDS